MGDENKSKQQLALSTPIEDLKDIILSEENVDELKDAIELFNLNIQKKELLRNVKYSDLQDKTLQEMEKRLENKSDELSNQDLLNYHKIIKDSMSSNIKNPLKDTPMIQLNSINIGVNDKDSLSRESRSKVINAVNSILGKLDTTQSIDNLEENDIIDYAVEANDDK